MSKQNVGIEEIQKIMQENNLSFSDIAKIAAGMNNGIITEKEKPTTKETGYEISSASYPDFTVTKTTATQTKILIISPSCDGYFIRTKTRNKNWEVEQLNEKNYANFAKDIREPIEFEDNFWLKNLPSGEQGYFTIMRYLETDGIMEMLKDKCAPKYIKEYAIVEVTVQQILIEFRAIENILGTTPFLMVNPFDDESVIFTKEQLKEIL